MSEPKCPNHESVAVSLQILREEVSKYNSNQSEMVRGLQDLRERVVIVEQSSKSAHHRLDSMEEQTKAVVRMSVSVELVVEKITDVLSILKEHSDRMDSQDDEIQTLKHAPATAVLGYWKMFVGAIVTAVASGMLGFVASRILK